jgi:hypothetical protein
MTEPKHERGDEDAEDAWDFQAVKRHRSPYWPRSA